jgi:hypothetical protein
MTGELLTIDGVTRTIPEWAREKGISRQLLRHRVRSGVPHERLFEAPRASARHSEEAVSELRRRVANGERLAAVARAIGMSESHARDVIDGFYRRRAKRGAGTNEASP